MSDVNPQACVSHPLTLAIMQPSVMVRAHGVRVMTSTNLQRLQNLAMSKASQGIGDWNYKSQQDLLKAKYPNMDPNFSLGDGPQTPQAAIPTGVFPSPEASPLPSPHPREIPLSTVSCISNPDFGDAADSQKLAASWVTNQHYGDAVDQVGTLHAALTRPVGTCRAAASCAQGRTFPGCILLQGQKHAQHLACLEATATAQTMAVMQQSFPSSDRVVTIFWPLTIPVHGKAWLPA